MLAGAAHGIDRANIVKSGSVELDLSLKIKRERMRAGPDKGFNVFGVIETIYFEPDRSYNRPKGTDAKVGRRLYWPDGGPSIARSIPEQDLLIVSKLPVLRGVARMPDVPDPEDVVENPYKVDRFGISHLADDRKPREPRKMKQDLSLLASAKHEEFLVFHPVAQIIVVSLGGLASFQSLGTARHPLSALTGFDGTKTALLINPATGEMFFRGGRYDLSDHINLTV